MYKREIKKIGKISKEICDRYNIYEFENYEICQSMDLYSHVNKHIKDFKDIHSFEKALLSIDKIIKKPLFVSYDKNRRSLSYYGKIDEYVCCIVKIKISRRYCYVATIYPVSKKKLNKAKEQSYLR